MVLTKSIVEQHSTDVSTVAHALQDTDHLSQCVFSIAVAALVPGPQQANCIRWLLENYVNNKSTWTAEPLSWQDSYISAYASAIALRGMGHLGESDRLLAGLQDNRSDTAQTETLTFGGLVGALDRYAADHQMPAVAHSSAIQAVIADEAHKLKRMLQWPEVYNPEVSIIGFIGECLYDNDQIDLDRYVQAFQMPNGSITSSPSASAMTVLNYMRRGQLAPQSLRDYVSCLDPYRRTVGLMDQISHLRTAWGLMYAATWHAELTQAEEVQWLRQDLDRSALVATGLNNCPPGDLDTGTVAMLGVNWPLANRIKQIESVSPIMFDSTQGCYRTFLFERNASVSTNVHVLAAWPDNPRREAMLAWLKGELSGTCDTWRCKWHISSYYLTGEISRLLCDMRHPVAMELVARARQYLLDTQRPDGGWGTAFSTTEETAYAVLALARSSRDADREPIVQEKIERAKAFLQGTPGPDYTPLWIGKTLYCIRPLVRILRHSALFHV